MLTKHLQKLKVIQTEDPNEFERQFNDATDQLHDKEFKSEIQPYNGHTHCAYIFWQEIEEVFNLVSDEFHAEGIHYLCGQCPFHDPAEDGRQKTVWCKYADSGMTHLKHEACEMFYKMVKQNEVVPLY